MRLTKQSRRNAKSLLRSCLVNGRLDEGRVRQVVEQVATAKPRGYVGFLTYFKHLIQLDIARHTARIESVAPLSPEQQAEVVGKLEQAYGPGLSLIFAQSAALIGGLRVSVGSDVYDGSVQGRLSALADSF
jgi:F-type H+-transporting ATPase subunit delta